MLARTHLATARSTPVIGTYDHNHAGNWQRSSPCRQAGVQRECDDLSLPTRR
jgi:hypothetical protein